MLEVLLSHWNFHLVTTFPSPEVLQKKQLHQNLTHWKFPSTCYDHQAAIPHVSLKRYLVHIPSVMVPQSVHHLHVQMLCKPPAGMLPMLSGNVLNLAEAYGANGRVWECENQHARARLPGTLLQQTGKLILRMAPEGPWTFIYDEIVTRSLTFSV